MIYATKKYTFEKLKCPKIVIIKYYYIMYCFTQVCVYTVECNILIIEDG